MAGFSLSYVVLDAGLGALILFGVVQITMFGWGAFRGTAPTARQMAGAGVAFAGLLLVLWPGPGSRTDPAGAVMMVIAGLGWAAYTISGKAEADPLPATAAGLCAVVCGAAASGAGDGGGGATERADHRDCRGGCHPGGRGERADCRRRGPRAGGHCVGSHITKGSSGS